MKHRNAGIFALWLMVAAVVSGASGAPAADIKPFTTDGCSLFPDGTCQDRTKWCDCCFAHDIVYWQGGTRDERAKADEGLRACVLERTHDTTLAEAMYLGVRAGGGPAFPTWYRWGYGWPYGRGYEPLTQVEKQQAEEQLTRYREQHPLGYCGERAVKHPVPIVDAKRPETGAADPSTHPKNFSPIDDKLK